MPRVLLAPLLLAPLLLACGAGRGEDDPPRGAPPTAPAPTPWLRGQLHTHSARSGDSETPPSEVLRWYAEHDFDFVVFTDHDHVTAEEAQGILAIPGVELTQNSRRCEPPPEGELLCLLHVNALVVGASHAGVVHVPDVGAGRENRFAAAIERSVELGGIAQLNHPNFHYAADASLISRLARRHPGLLLEVANEAVDSNNAGDAQHPSTESIWDAVLTDGSVVWATATDDAHHYGDADAVRARGGLAHVGGRGWVVVQARPDAASIREALRRGEFYASTGPTLASVSRRNGRLVVQVPADVAVPEIRLIGEGGVCSGACVRDGSSTGPAAAMCAR